MVTMCFLSKDIMIKWLLNRFNGTIADTDNNSFSISNPMGHALIPTYLNAKQPTTTNIDKRITNSLTYLETNSNQQAFFTIDFIYAGKNMNFSITEPNGNKLYQNNQTGKTGYLLVTKKNQEGAVKYVASCDDTKLQIGTYKIQIKEPKTLLREQAKLIVNSYLNDHGAIKQNGITTWNYLVKVNFDNALNTYSYTTNLTQADKNKIRTLAK